MTRLRSIVAATGLLLGALQPVIAQVPTTVPAAEEEGPFSEVRAVRVGIDGPGMDACGTTGVVTPGTDAPVLAAPDPAAAEIERLPAGLVLYMCEELPGWRGVVYATEGDPWETCETGSPVPQEMNYPGPCRSGWIAAERFEMMAG